MSARSLQRLSVERPSSPTTQPLWCVARTSRAASVEPLEEPVRAVDGSRSPRRRERLRERVQEATGGAGRLGRR